MSIMDILSRAEASIAVIGRKGRFRSEVALKQACRVLTAPHYARFESLFERDWAFCTNGYFIASEGRLTGYILTSEHQIADVGPTVFLGLSAGESERVGRAQTVKAYALALLDTTRTKPPTAWVWGTTVSPVVYLATSSYLADFAPLDQAQSISAQASIAARIVEDRSDWGWPPPQQHEPFVMRGVSRSVQYSASESERLHAMRNKAPLFDALDVSEQRGDRLLFVGRPPEPRLTQLLTTRVLRGTTVVDLSEGL